MSVWQKFELSECFLDVYSDGSVKPSAQLRQDKHKNNFCLSLISIVWMALHYELSEYLALPNNLQLLNHNVDDTH